jgi:hypothetical protein
MIKEVKNYLEKLQDFKDVCKGGKDFYSCSFMDISCRSDRMEEAKKKAIKALGKLELEKIENDIETTISRLEIITENGREFVDNNSIYIISFQDDNKTLKLFKKVK